mmetsp:Transcript_12436/g.34206  ORF Transcript_12436/g.34206 Transcript_12436/m.34206 type:complete len:364 (+) Transcript_12436:408-1499(+)
MECFHRVHRYLGAVGLLPTGTLDLGWRISAPHRCFGLRGRHRHPHIGGHGRPRLRYVHRTAQGLFRIRRGVPAVESAAGGDGGGAAVDGLVRLQRRLRALLGLRRRLRRDQHPHRGVRVGGGVAGAVHVEPPPRRHRHLQRCSRRPRRHHAGLGLRQHPGDDAHRGGVRACVLLRRARIQAPPSHRRRPRRPLGPRRHRRGGVADAGHLRAAADGQLRRRLLRLRRLAQAVWHPGDRGVGGGALLGRGHVPHPARHGARDGGPDARGGQAGHGPGLGRSRRGSVPPAHHPARIRVVGLRPPQPGDVHAASGRAARQPGQGPLPGRGPPLTPPPATSTQQRAVPCGGGSGDQRNAIAERRASRA